MTVVGEMPVVASDGHTVFVASAGGHLTELQLLASRFSSGTRTWVSWNRDQLMRGSVDDRRITLRPVPPRSPWRAIRALVPAFRIIRGERPSQVVTTGAAIAIPFLVAARLCGITPVYVESVARQSAPSLTGRVVSYLPGVRLLSQARFEDPRWVFIGSVLDHYGPVVAARPRAPLPPGQARPLHVLVTVGTMRFPFTRLVRLVRPFLPNGARTTWQIGSSASPPPSSQDHVVATMPAEDLHSAMAGADVIITHAGVGTCLEALSLGHRPIVLPRLAQHGEHVDDHQVELVESLLERSLAIDASRGPGAVEEALRTRIASAQASTPAKYLEPALRHPRRADLCGSRVSPAQ
jgi:UDP-N-acetylglucosamine--N-acetylmuramyl-(pentapeptide) pyrophosphoryl-undecaprenol N-acetylglucosamine transferase